MNRSRFAEISRRRLLTALGLGTGALFLPSLLKPGAVAQTPRIKRLLIMIESHGTVHQNWWMRRNNPALGNWEYPFDDANPESFSRILRPLHAMRQKLLVLEGLAQTSTLGDRATNNHDAAHSHLLTGAKMVEGDNPGGISVDQRIAQVVARPDRLPSLEYDANGVFKGGFINSGPNQRVPPENDVVKAFERLFPEGTDPDTEPTEREKIRKEQANVLGRVKTEYEALAPRLGTEDRQKIELHRDHVRDLEARIRGLGDLECGAPERPAGTIHGPEAAKIFGDLAAAAFACDITRVATIQMGQLDNDHFGAPPGDVHQDFAHQAGTDANAIEQMTKYNEKHAEVFLHLMTTLDRYPDVDGTLLDNTALVWLTELANGPHDLREIPIVVAGSCGGYLSTGRYVSYEQNTPNPHEFPNWGPDAQLPIGPSHSQFLVSLMQAMGLSDNSIGMTEVVTRDGNNTTVDLTGPLPRVAV